MTGFLLLVLLVQTACSNLQSNLSTVELSPFLQDQWFPAVPETFRPESPEDLFSLPESYRRQLDIQVLSEESEYERYKKLRQWAFRRFEDFEFSSLETVSLAELNSARKINCLSFSALFVAAARYTNVPAEFQLVFAPPYWDQVNTSWINNQHINVTGTIEVPVTAYVPQRTGRLGDIPVRFGDGDLTGTYRYVADVNPAVVSMRTRRQIISENEVISLFYSNKTIEHLLRSDLAAAYAYTKLALQTYPESSLAWNNLGVLYSRVNQTELAIAAYEIAISADDNAYSARSNLARLYRRTGQENLARGLEREIARFRESNPYYHASLAEAELEKGNLQQARSLYREALQRKHNEQHFYHQLAIISQALGNNEEVKEHLRSAQRYARGEDRARFANKLQALEDLL